MSIQKKLKRSFRLLILLTIIACTVNVILLKVVDYIYSATATVVQSANMISAETDESSKHITEITAESAGAVGETAQAVKGSMQVIEDSAEHLKDVGDSFQMLHTSVRQIYHEIEEISVVSEQVSASSEQFSASMNNIARYIASTSAQLDSVAKRVHTQTNEVECIYEMNEPISNDLKEIAEQLQRLTV